MTEILFVIEESPEGGLNARAIHESIFTEGDNIDDLKKTLQRSSVAILKKNPSQKLLDSILSEKRLWPYENSSQSLW